MQKFEVKSLEVCPQTGISSFEIQWDAGHGQKTDRGSFLVSVDLDEYIRSSKRSFILIVFSDYVNHIRRLLETGHHDFYQKEEKIMALDRCTRYTEWLDDKKLEEICKILLTLQDDMRRILPSPANASFDSCESKILDIVIFCKSELWNVPKGEPKPVSQGTP